jgi:hypothetical protein
MALFRSVLLVVAGVIFGVPAESATIYLKARIDPAQAATASTADGGAFFTYDTVSRLLTWTVTYRNLESSGFAAHIHGPAVPGVDAGVVVPFNFTASPMTGSMNLTTQQEADLLAGLYYVNIHTTTYPNGAIRGQIAQLADTQYKTLLDGAQAGTQGSPIPTAGSGTGTVTFDPATLQMSWNITFGSLTSAPFAAHFHGPGKPFESAGITVPTGSTSPITGNATITTAQATQLVNGWWYHNIHTGNYGNGEIRGQVLPVQQLNVAIGGTGSGSVSASGPAPAMPGAFGIVCPVYCNELYDENATITLTATAAGGSTFTGWVGAGCSGTQATCNVTMNATKNVAARFSDPSAANPVRLFNISTRMPVLTGNDVMIAGFVIGGSTPKTVVVNVAGPSLANYGITNPLANPKLTLVRQSDQSTVKSNDDWQAQAVSSDVAALLASGFQPNDPLEPAVVATLAPGAYTAIVEGVNNTTGVGLVGVFEVDHAEIPVVNISTRGQVQTNNDVMIAGFIIQGNTSKTVVINVAGPNLVQYGITNALMNPKLTLVRGSDQTIIGVNDDWQTQTNPADVAAIQATGFQPNQPQEPALIATLPPGAYTAIVEGVGGSTGVGLVGVFAVP